MRFIPITDGSKAKVSNKDFAYLSQFTWTRHVRGYPIRSLKINGKKGTVTMHRDIMKPEKGMEVDHKNSDPLDNRRENLRVCTLLENRRNRTKRKDSGTNYKGVSFKKRFVKHWVANISVSKKTYYLGAFKTEKEAAKAYDKAAKKLHGVFAKLNLT